MEAAASRQRAGHWTTWAFVENASSLVRCVTLAQVSVPFLRVFVHWQGLEHLQWCLVCDPGQYNWMKKIQLTPVWLRKIKALHNWACALCTCRKECNKYDLTASQCFWLAHCNDWSKWFAISSPPPNCCHSFSFVGGVAKEYITKTWMWKIFSQGRILSTAGDALRGLV
jgi:hypothetical protein